MKALFLFKQIRVSLNVQSRQLEIQILYLQLFKNRHYYDCLDIISYTDIYISCP
jgi:hypothetical protein